MEFDNDKIDDMVLALLALTTFDQGPYGARAWKGHAWEVLDRLHEKGFIDNPVGKAKSVWLTEDGLKRSQQLFEQHFAS